MSRLHRRDPDHPIQSGLDTAPFISALHIAFGVGVVASLLGAVVSASRGRHLEFGDEAGVAERVAA